MISHKIYTCFAVFCCYVIILGGGGIVCHIDPHDCPCASGFTLKNISKMDQHLSSYNKPWESMKYIHNSCTENHKLSSSTHDGKVGIMNDMVNLSWCQLFITGCTSWCQQWQQSWHHNSVFIIRVCCTSNNRYHVSIFQGKIYFEFCKLE